MELSEQEKDERLSAEEERMNKHLARKQPAQAVKKQAPPTTPETTEYVEVHLVNSVNYNTVMEKELVYLNRGRIPIAELQKKWRFKNPIWIDLDEPVGTMSDGYSDTNFQGCKVVRIKATNL
eukprot:TRINITY_DN15367_c0_g1_i1.p1 TRINITY_DN15367_c0_g1~~TRINITY_DN15367_c0_g1_i1.p1  ORF type:complete len:122 (+),score=15.80 TRINITY_DN15367_c0_g1_i1:37-402(+)